MSMMNILAMLLSLAMMLTGGAGQEGAQARTLLVKNVSLTVNGEHVTLEPTVRLGAYTDGEAALFDFGVDSQGEALLPLQLRADADGLAVLFEKSDVLARVSQAALEGATALTQAPDAASMEAAGVNPELFAFLTGEFKDAYMGLIEAVQDPEFTASLQSEAEALMDGIVDRGEGTALTEEVDGVEYALTEYHYTMDSAQLAKLCDGVFGLNDVLKNYYDALFKLYAMLPEEAGLSGIGSYADLFEKTGLTMTMDMDEKRTEDGAVALTDAVITVDMSAMMTKMAGEQAETVNIEPIVMNVHAVKADQSSRADMDMSFAANGSEADMSMRMVQDYDAVMADVTMFLYNEGESAGSVHMNFGQGAAAEDGAVHSHADIDIDMGEKGSIDLSCIGRMLPDNLGESSVTLGGEMNGTSFELSFDAELIAGAFEDKIAGREANIAVDDLSQEALSALMNDESTVQTAMQIAGSMSADAQKLMGEESVQAFSALLASAAQSVQEAAAPQITVEEVDPDTVDDSDLIYDAEDLEGVSDDDHVIDLDEMEADEDGDYVIDIEDLEDGNVEFEMDDFDDGFYEEVEDDGVLGFNAPELGWLPEGWTVLEQNEDTAYDWVDISIQNADGEDALYAVFFVDEDAPQANYIVADSGAITPVEGREISVGDFGEGSLTVTLHENGLYGNLIFSDDSVDIDTVGRIVAGIKY